MITILVFLALAAAITLLAFRFRHAVRGIWQAHEQLKKELNNLQLQHIQEYRETYGELAGLIMKRDAKVPFHAQHGEDIFLWNHFGRKADGYFIEVGAHDGVSLSNTYAFEAIGWKGLLVEANPDVAELCRKNRPESIVAHTAVGAPGQADRIVFHTVSGDEGDEMLSFVNPDDADIERCTRAGKSIRKVEVPFKTMDSILDELSPEQIDFVTIDVEGGEMDVLKGFDLARFEPKVVMLENNTGHADYPVSRYMERQGYQRFHHIGCNEFYCREQREQ